ncbi:MAG TPA: hypothetical protein VNX25_05730 [Verrucomicrobiae bacterium]|nr:hypothetical protein [Verrucomicrobiae bacterium]
MNRKLHACVGLAMTVLLAGNAAAAEKFGLVFDIQGNVEVRSADGKITRLEKEKHILYPVKEGDRLKTGAGAGKMVVVALKDKTGYELPAGCEAVVEGAGVKALKGTVRTHRSLSVSSGSPGGPIGAIVLRGTPPLPPVEAVAPADTAVLDPAPELRWAANCPTVKEMTLQLSEEGAEVLRTTVAGTSFRVPTGVLREGKRYSWAVDAGSCGRGEAEFSVPPDRGALRAELEQRRAAAVQLPERLSLLFTMIDRGLRQEARVELEKLKTEFPENRYLREL